MQEDTLNMDPLTDISIEPEYLTQDAQKYPQYCRFSREVLPSFEQVLKQWFEPIDSPQKQLIQAGRYAVFNGGKRIRPLLLLAVARHYNVEMQQALAIAGAIELIHTYSLIHDDLPCMDDDDFRRGKKSLHKIIGEGLALLTGDFLLTYSFDRLSATETIDSTNKIKLIQTITKAAGHQGMVGGQYLDLTAHQHPNSKELLQWIHRKKTGALFTASVVCGAILAKCNTDELHAWEKLGQELGLLFQLIDDLLDFLPSTLTTRIPLGPSSYIVMEGVDKTWEEVQALQLRIEQDLNLLCGSKSLLHELLELMCARYQPPPK